MKKSFWLYLGLCIFVLVDLVVFGISTIKHMKAADTVEEAFYNDFGDKFQINDILTDQDISLVTYFNEEDVLAHELIIKKDMKWRPLPSYHKNERVFVLKNSECVVFEKKVNDRTVLYFYHSCRDAQKKIELCDQLNSEFLLTSAIAPNGDHYAYGLLVLETPLPNDYFLTIDGETVAFD